MRFSKGPKCLRQKFTASRLRYITIQLLLTTRPEEKSFVHKSRSHFMSDQISTKTQSEVSALIVRSHIYRFMACLFRRPGSDKVDPKKEHLDLPWDEIAAALPLRNKAR